MPPPPAGMKALAPAEAQKLAEKADATDDSAADDDDATPDSAQDSDELEAMHALEQVALDPSTQPRATALESVGELGIASPVRARIDDELEDWGLREDPSPLDLPPVKDLSSFDVAQVAREYDIPIEMQPLVAQYIRFFRGPGRHWFKKWMERSTRYIPLMRPILEAQGLPGDTVYLAMIESGFSTDAYSWAHAVGPWQFVAATGKTFGLKQDFWVDERRDPVKATFAAAKYLKQLHDQLGNWYLAWAAYNTGGQRIRRTMKRMGTDDFWQLSHDRYLADETKEYVPKLIACALVAKHPTAFGFKEDELHYDPALAFDEVKVADPTDLAVIAHAAGTDVKTLRLLNPELKRWCTPPASDEHPYVLRIPKGTSQLYAQNIAKVAPRERLTFRVHRVRRGDTLSAIARTYHSAVIAILQVNHLKSARALRINKDLVIPVPRKGPIEVARSGPGERPAERPAIGRGEVRRERFGLKTRVSYGVEEGDSLWSVAQKFGVSVQSLRRWNHLRRHSRLQIGSVLQIWQRGAHAVQLASNDDAHHKTVQIAEGETLWSVAHRYGVSVDDLKRWNGITQVRSVKAGQELTLITP